MIIARRWRTRKSMIALFIIEFFFTVAALTLYALAQPDLYRTRLWQDGADNGFNSSPADALYDYANHDKVYKKPLVWSQFITDYNVTISVLSMFILLTKVVMFVMHTLLPVVSVVTHVALVALYAVSTYAQAAPDMSDPVHPQPGAPWYITKKCSVVYQQSNYGYCEQAKACFAITLCMLCLFATFLVLAIWSSVPTKGEKLARFSNLQRSDLPSYAPETTSTSQPQWEKRTSQVRLTHLRSPTTPGARYPTTPRTVAFRTLEGGRSGSSTRSLPFRERYGE